jgi:hypothetical protein
MIDIKKARRIPKDADLSRIHPDLRDKAVPCSLLTAHPDNPRIHGEANRRAIAGSLKRFQQRQLIVVNRTEAGLRIEAHHEVFRQMLELGSEYVAVAIMEDDPITELGFLLADNRTGDLSEDDPEKLAPILKQLAAAGEDVEEVGWDDESVRRLLGQTSHTPDDDEEDEAPAPVDRAGELQKEWKTDLGQLWLIPSKAGKGVHRVLCGDSLDPASIDLVLGGQVPDGVWSDAPYGMRLDTNYSSRPLSEASAKKHKTQNTFAPVIGDSEDFDPTAILGGLTHVKEQFWWGADYYRKNLPDGGSWIVWDKRAGIEDVQYSSAEFELCWSKTQHARSIARIRWFGICGMEAEKGTKRVHPTQKPIALFEWCAEKYLPDPGKIWLDPFAGSGISLLGAEKRGQIACCIELSPAYVAVILQRAKDAGMSPRLADV